MIERDQSPELFSYSGTYAAIVVNVRGDTFMDSGFRVGMARDISYDVVVNFPDGPKFYQQQIPHHRRPAEQSLIIAALPDDECIAVMRGNNVRFIIHESVFSEACT
jgi:hypothetical protein